MKPNLYKKINVVLDGKPFPIKVHQFCAYQKYGDAIFDEGIVVRHLNNNSLDNSLDNLGFGTYSDNMLDKTETQRTWQAYIAGSKNSRTDWDKIDSARDSGMSYRELEKTYGVPKSSLSYRYGNGKRIRLAEDTVHSLELLYSHT